MMQLSRPSAYCGLRMPRGILLGLCLLVSVGAALAVDIVDLPDALPPQYDVTWQMAVAQPTRDPLVLTEGDGRTQGFRLSVADGTVTCDAFRGAQPPVRVTAAWTPAPPPVALTLKRRADRLALLVNHRLLLTAPLFTPPATAVQFTAVPPTVSVTDARFRPYEAPRFGDDFMRPEALETLLLSQLKWTEDAVWPVGHFRVDEPGTTLPQADRDALANPWQLSLFPVTKTTTNGFWFMYTGIGPSWVTSNPLLSRPNWDSYVVEAAVRPDYDSAVGLLAAYQDPKNYLLFRWHPRSRVTATQPGAELIAMTDGTPTVLAISSVGFEPGQWYQMRLCVGWRRVQVYVDGQPLLDAANTGLVEGRVGLYADGAKDPDRPRVDTATATMYAPVDEQTGKVLEDVDAAVTAICGTFFDDLRVGPWDVQALAETARVGQAPSGWRVTDDTVTATTPGMCLLGGDAPDAYTLEGTLTLPARGRGGLVLHADAAGTGTAWLLTPTRHALVRLVRGRVEQELLAVPATVPAETPVSVKVVVDGAYLACWCNGRRVLEYAFPTIPRGSGGVVALTPGMAFAGVTLTPTPASLTRPRVHPGFAQDRFLATWASGEADWYPAVLPEKLATPTGVSHTEAGAAAPLPTDAPGLYWHKGGHYGTVAITVPVTPATLAGQTLYLTTNYRQDAGYRLVLPVPAQKTPLRLYRGATLVASAPVTLAGSAFLVWRRHGSYLLVDLQPIDPESDRDDPVVTGTQRLLSYRDPAPLSAEQVGFAVTAPLLPAVLVQPVSARQQEAFEQAPVGWRVQHGLWSVMARYTCSPQWNWFGGFGAGQPAIWSKGRLQGNQTVEAYLGIKMRSNEDHAEYAERYRDVAVTICGDGEHVVSGYTLIRGERTPEGQQTRLLRNGVPVQSTTARDFLFPTGIAGHRHWFATRLEKRGGEVKVFLDNRLAMTYTDPDPLPGGYVALWTRDNGILVGRVNYAAEGVTPPVLDGSLPSVVTGTLHGHIEQK